ncbi:MAG: D-alanyl-D-alanine carboxypeptidase DacF [Chlamydiales bacterium]|nr:D-alanyl-D-alanine carboxypeptidase DacF [Chlamydiales bacterium]
MKWFLSLLLLLPSLYAQQLDLKLDAEGVILINAETGAILYEKNAYTPTFPASTTKIATALYALDRQGMQLGNKMLATRECVASITPQAKKQSNYRSPSHWLETDGSHIGIKSGEELRFYDLLAAMLISSANDASNVIAYHVGGSISNFMTELGHYLKGIGCKSTSFNNPHGLHHPQHVTTPYDLAVMAQVGLKNPIFRKIVSTKRYTCPQTNLEHERTFLQTNKLLRSGSSEYPKAIGVKTGTTQAAGKNLVAAAESEGRCLIAVLLGYRGAREHLYRDAIKLFDTAFQEQKMRRVLLKVGTTDLTTHVIGARGRLKTTLPMGLNYDYYPAEESVVKAQVHWDLPSLPISKGDRVGTVSVVDASGNVVQETGLMALTDLKPTVWYRLTTLFSDHKKGKSLLFGGGVGLLCLFFWRLRKKQRFKRH